MTAPDHLRAFVASGLPGPGAPTVLLIVNPVSRSGQRALEPVLRALQEADVLALTAETAGPKHATQLVRDRIAAHPGLFSAVLTLGGDGTAMEVASALSELENAPPLGIIALGTANILARTLGIPMGAPRAVAALLDADAVAIDVGRVEGGPAFAIGLGVGLDASMISGASAAWKRRIGFAAYALSAMRAGLRLERFRATITVDETVHVVDTSSVLVANFGTVLGGLVCFGEGIGHRDGTLDVCIYSPGSYLSAVRIFWRMLTGTVSHDRDVRILRGRRIRIETDPPRLMQADGELLGLTPVDIRVEPAAIRVLVPRQSGRGWRLPRATMSLIRTEPLEQSAQ